MRSERGQVRPRHHFPPAAPRGESDGGRRREAAARPRRLPLERAELLQSKAGTAGAGVVTLIDCAGCSLNDMKRFVLAVSE